MPRPLAVALNEAPKRISATADGLDSCVGLSPRACMNDDRPRVLSLDVGSSRFRSGLAVLRWIRVESESADEGRGLVSRTGCLICNRIVE